MKTLLVLRHAKSSWSDPSLNDHDRPLSKRGKQAAPRMGRLLLSEELVPDLIISSSAKRARKTAQKVATAMEYHGSIELSPQLYLGGPEAYLERIQASDAHIQRIMVVGHNPDVEELIAMLCGGTERMPTAALAHIEAAIPDWRELDAGCDARLVNLWRPRELAS